MDKFKDLKGKEMTFVDDERGEIACFVAGIDDENITITELETQNDIWCINKKDMHEDKYHDWYNFTLKAIKVGKLIEADNPHKTKNGYSAICAFK